MKRKINKICLLIAPLSGLTLGVSSLMLMTSCNKTTDDQKTLEQMNTILDSAKPNTMAQVISTLKASNINLEEKVPTNTTDQFVWDCKNNKIVIIKQDGTLSTGPTKGYQLPDNHFIWKMVRGNSSTQLKANNVEPHMDHFSSDVSYSQYLRSNYTYDSTLEFLSGIDTTAIKDYKELVFKNNPAVSPADKIIINTYSDSLKVESECQDLQHYGSLLDLTVTAQATSSSKYQEYGTIAGNATLSAGTLVAEPTCTINTIVIADKDVKPVEVKTDGTNTAYVGTVGITQEVKDAGGQTTQYVNDEGIAASDKPDKPSDPITPADPESEDLSGLGTEKSPYIVTCKADFTKIHDFYSVGYKYFKYVSTEKTIDGSDWETNNYFGNLNGSFDGNGLIINKLSRPLFNLVGTGRTDTNVQKISNITLNCEICTTNSTAGLVRTLSQNAELSNIEIHGHISGSNYAGSFVAFGPGNFDVPVGSSVPAVQWTFIKCHSDATITSTGSWDAEAENYDVHAGGMIGYAYAKSYTDGTEAFKGDESQLNFIDSYFDGNISTNYVRTAEEIEQNKPFKNFGYFTSGTEWNSLRIRTEYTEWTTSQFGGKTPEELGFYTLPANKNDDGWFYVGNASQHSQIEDYRAVEGYIYKNHRAHIDSGTMPEPAQKGSILEGIAKQPNTTAASAALFFGPDDKQDKGNFVAPFLVDDELDVSGDTLKTINVKNYYVKVNDGTHEHGTIENNIFYISDNGKFYGTKCESAFILVTQYQEMNGALVPIYVTSCTIQNFNPTNK